MKKKFCFISHTHWDREWYVPLEIMKLRLCDLMDRCLDLLESDPRYCFHLDAQTIVLEDYLSIRPNRRSILEKFVKNGQLIIGPWYMQNDFFLTSGEATVRNLLEGRRTAEEYGACDNVGYAPDQFGHISQMPQILNGFGIDNYVFGRAVDKTYSDGSAFPSEFLWEGPDGSILFAVHMRFWYNNAQHLSDNLENAKLLVETSDKLFDGIAQTPFILMMNGVDHIEAQTDLLSILQDVSPSLPQNFELKQHRLSSYIDDVQKYIQDNGIKMETVHGEMRKGFDWEILKGTLSSRYYLKAANVRAQTMLENRLEPLYSMLELSGMKGAYSLDHFRYMWKDLLKNHPHDSICGCSCDAVHSNMENNYFRLELTMNDMFERGMKLAARQLDLGGRNADNYIITLTNTTQNSLAGVVPVVIDIKKEDNFNGFTIKDGNGENADFIVLSKKDAIRDGSSPLNLPGNFQVDRYNVLLNSKAVLPFAISGYVVEGSNSVNTLEKAINCINPVLENEFLTVTVHIDGSVDMLNKKTGRLFKNVLDIEETGDRGDSYVYSNTFEDAIYGSQFPAEVTVAEKNRLKTEVHIKREMILPKEYNFNNLTRSDETASTSVTIILTLTAQSPHLEIGFEVDNNSKDHRIRLTVNTGVDCEEAFAETPFDYVSRTDADHHVGTGSKVFPNATFVTLPEIAVLTEGAHEYEHIRENGVLAFTIVRSTGAINRNGSTHEHVGGEIWSVPENQCLRNIKGRIAILPFEGEDAIAAEVHVHSVQFRTGLGTLFFSSDDKRFMQGRAAVQDSRLEEFFFHPNPYEGVAIADNTPLLTLQNLKGILITALKKSEYDDDLILRLVNYTATKSNIKINVDADISKISMDETSNYEHIAKDNIIVKEKEILTLKLIK